jgi:hypothetical protein
MIFLFGNDTNLDCPLWQGADFMMKDEYRYFQIDPKFTEDKYVQMAEARPGNRTRMTRIERIGADLFRLYPR